MSKGRYNVGLEGETGENWREIRQRFVRETVRDRR